MENQEPTDEPTRYAVRLLPVALRDLDEATVFVADTSGKAGTIADDYAAAFRKGFFAAAGTLATMPLRFPVAREADLMARPAVRVMPYRQSPNSPVWRVLYRVLDADENDTARVEIAALLHGAQKPMIASEASDIDAANR